MIDPFGLEIARERQKELMREAQERRITGALRKARRSRRGVPRESEGIEVGWGLAEEESAVATPYLPDAP